MKFDNRNMRTDAKVYQLVKMKIIACILKLLEAIKKAIGTRVSRAVPHLSTHLALNRLTSEFGWDPVHLA